MEAACKPHISQEIVLVDRRSISRAPRWGQCPAVTWGHTSACRRSARGNHLGSIILNVRNSKSFVSEGIGHPLDAGQLSLEINLLPVIGRRETFVVSWAGWGLIRVCPGFPNATLSQGSSAVRESND